MQYIRLTIFAGSVKDMVCLYTVVYVSWSQICTCILLLTRPAVVFREPAFLGPQIRNWLLRTYSQVSLLLWAVVHCIVLVDLTKIYVAYP